MRDVAHGISSERLSGRAGGFAPASFRFLGVSNVEHLHLSVANKSIKLKGSSNAGEDRENSACKSILDYFSSDIELEHRLTSENQAYHGII